MVEIAETAIYNGKKVKILPNSVAKNDAYVPIVLEDGSSVVVRKDALLFDFSQNNSNQYKNLMFTIEQRDEEIAEGQTLIKQLSKYHTEQKDLMNYNRKEKNKVLAQAGVSTVSQLNDTDTKRYNYFAGLQSNARKMMNKACSNILSKTISLVGLILGTGDLKLQAIAMK